MAHTPTPWGITEGRKGHFGQPEKDMERIVLIQSQLKPKEVNGAEATICEMKAGRAFTFNPPSPLNHEANVDDNAAFIVRCVNNFETVNLHFQRTHKALETLVRFCRENGMEVHQVAEAVEQLQLNEAVRLAATRG